MFLEWESNTIKNFSQEKGALPEFQTRYFLHASQMYYALPHCLGPDEPSCLYSLHLVHGMYHVVCIEFISLTSSGLNKFN
jgi:hypothetical protein